MLLWQNIFCVQNVRKLMHSDGWNLISILPITKNLLRHALTQCEIQCIVSHHRNESHSSLSLHVYYYGRETRAGAGRQIGQKIWLLSSKLDRKEREGRRGVQAKFRVKSRLTWDGIAIPSSLLIFFQWFFIHGQTWTFIFCHLDTVVNSNPLEVYDMFLLKFLLGTNTWVSRKHYFDSMVLK